jgi:Thioredoxin-like
MTRRVRLWRWAREGGVAALVLWGGAVPAWAAPTPAQILGFAPRQVGVDCTTPTAEQHKDCKVELVKGPKGSGWQLSDRKGPVRRFADTNADNKIDTWAYYKDGVEVYREMDTDGNGKPDHYRWLNAGGSKWGIDRNEDGRIDSWKAISPEEVSQELLLAVRTRDYARVQALLLTEAEIGTLGLPPAEAQKYRASLAEARSKFDALVSKLKGMEKASWLHLETGTPQCRPAAEEGPKADQVRYVRGTVLYETGGKSDFLQTGELVQVGSAWRLVSGPAAGGADQVPSVPGTAVANNPQLQKLVEELTEIDKSPPAGGTPGPNPAVVQYNLKRADVLEKIIAVVSGSERDTWIRQVADSLSAAMQSAPEGDTTAAGRLERLEKQITQAMPGSGLAGYVVYRGMQARYSANLMKKGADYNKVQQEWLSGLVKFVSTYPKSDDAAEGLLQLGMGSEFLGKDAEAKKWYGQLAADFRDRPQAAKARGALKRLDSVGKEFELSAPLLSGGAFDMSKVRGKIVVVYYWASWNQQSAGDFARLKQILDAHGSKGVELVCVNLDGSAEEASAAVKKISAPGLHVHQAGGLESGPATDYGIMVLPHLFLVGKDGKVVSRTIQLGSVEDEVKKLLK